jgi:hypothetical protein
LEIFIKANGAITQKWEMDHILGKMEIPMWEVLFLIKDKEKETINGEKEKNYAVGGKITSLMEILLILLMETPMSSKF